MFDAVLMSPHGEKKIIDGAISAYKRNYFEAKHGLADLLKKWPDKQHLIKEVEALYKL